MEPTDNLPDPLTPADCNLRGLPFMPLDTERLLDSDMMALSTGEEFKTALRLWCKSWNQEPAASLPDDDRILAHLAGRELASWKKVRQMALRGFVKCSDGRLYHPVIAEKALEAWRAREEHQAQKDGDNERKREEREDRKLLFAALREIGVVLPAKGTQTSHLRKVAESHGIKITVTEGHKVVTVTPNGSHKDSHGKVTAKTGTGTVLKEKEEKAAAASPPRAPAYTHVREGPTVPPLAAGTAVPTAMSAQTRYAVMLRTWERERGKASSTTSEDPRLKAWAEHGVTDEQLREAYDLAVADRDHNSDPGPISAGFLDVFLAKLRQQASSSQASALNAPTRQGAKAAAANWQAEMTALVAGTNQPTTRIIDMGAADVIDNDR